MDLEERVFRTVRIADERGYNLSMPRLSRQLIGGPEDIQEIERIVRSSGRLSMSEGYVGLKGRLRPRECVERSRADRDIGETYRRIACAFCEELASDHPKIRMIAIGGSLASNGLCRGEDIDLDIVVDDGSKYSTYLSALYLGMRYSIKHRDLTDDRYLGILPKLICVNVVWEGSQVAPFERRDEQMAYEVLNCEVVYGPEFYDAMVGANPWIIDLFPQIRRGPSGPYPSVGGGSRKNSVRETLSRFVVFSLYRLVHLSRTFNTERKERMDRAERVKHPYGIFDEPVRRKR